MNRRKCRGCGEWYKPNEGDNLQIKCCSEKCIQTVLKAHWDKKAKKAKETVKKKEAARKKKKKDSTKTRKRAAKEACHEYIRFRDKDELCICCGQPLGENYHAGHFLESGNNSKIRYDEDNINGQRLRCNYYKGGDSGDYERNLRIKIGDKRVDRLIANKGGTMKRTADDYREIEKDYKEKLKELQLQSEI